MPVFMTYNNNLVLSAVLGANFGNFIFGNSKLKQLEIPNAIENALCTCKILTS